MSRPIISKGLTYEKLMDDTPDPRYATKGSACFDLGSNETVTIKAGETKAVSTGLTFDIPKGYELQIRSRSGLAAKGVRVANGVGTIDSDYTGVVKILLRSDIKFDISRGQRIAQAILVPVTRARLKHGVVLKTTERGEGGFGSTGR
jgi:dUTP pyrophosphatase